MPENAFRGFELQPDALPAGQLFILLHGVGSRPSDLVPLANHLKKTFPRAACFLPEGTHPFEGGGHGRQWFSITGVTEENRAARVAAAMPGLLALVKHAQDRFNVLPPDTALVGFSQG